MSTAPLPLPPLDHLTVLSDDVGVVQHASGNVPLRASGYCTDDIARAFIVALQYLRLGVETRTAERLASTCLAFLLHAQREDGRFRNFMSYERAWLDEIGTHDSNGRAVWALGYGVRHAPAERWRALCAEMLERWLPNADGLSYLRAKAYAALGLAHAVAAGAEEGHFARVLSWIAGQLRAAYQAARCDGWEWFEETMTYDNARLCEALLRAAAALDDETFGEPGLRTFSFYLSVTVRHGIFVPVGNHGWYRRGGARAIYGQQPLDAAALVDAAHAAFDLSGDPAHGVAAALGLEWFHGRNTLSLSLVRGGSCCDGLEEHGVNTNMGAESTLAYLASAAAAALRQAAPLRAAR